MPNHWFGTAAPDLLAPSEVYTPISRGRRGGSASACCKRGTAWKRSTTQSRVEEPCELSG